MYPKWLLENIFFHWLKIDFPLEEGGKWLRHWFDRSDSEEITLILEIVAEFPEELRQRFCDRILCPPRICNTDEDPAETLRSTA